MERVVLVDNLMLGPFTKFNIEVPLNSFTIITGSNKSGKSLLLKVIAGVVNAKRVTYNREIIKDDKDIAFFADFVFNFNSVLKTIRYPLECLGMDDEKIKKIVKDNLSPESDCFSGLHRFWSKVFLLLFGNTAPENGRRL